MRIKAGANQLTVDQVLGMMECSMSSLYRYILDYGFPAGKRISDIDTRKFQNREEVQNQILEQVGESS